MRPNSSRISENLSPREAHRLISIHEEDLDFVIVDLRTPQEYARGKIKKAINLDYHSPAFIDDLKKLNKEKTYLIYCLANVRSANALKLMGHLGFREVYNLLGGIRQWYHEGQPIVHNEKK